MALTYQESGDSKNISEVRTANIFMLGIIGLSLSAYVYLHKEPAVNPEELYPQPACFSELPQSVQNDFLLNREFVMRHPDLSESTISAMLENYCPEENIIELPGNFEPVSINP